MNLIQFETLSERNKIVVDEFKKFIDKNLNKKHNNCLYVKDEYDGFSKAIWHPVGIYLISDRISSWMSIDEKFVNFNGLSNCLSSPNLFRAICLLNLNIVLNVEQKDLLNAYWFLKHKRFFCPEIKEVFVIDDKHALDKSIFE